jgi:ABC-type glucose/galactose transport system permease subunit
MRSYKTRPVLWIVASLATFIVIGLAVRWNNKGEGVSMAGSMIRYFADLLRGRDEIFAEPFVYLTFWSISAIAVGWLLQSLVVILWSRYGKSQSSA